MKAVIVLALAFLAIVQAEEKHFAFRKDVQTRGFYKGNRIIHGTEAQQGQFPWQVAVYYQRSTGDVFFCGGTLISPSYVITAAHCADDARVFSLFLGDTRLDYNGPGTETIIVNGSEATIHPDYNPTNLNNDLALIRLPAALEETETIKPIRIPQRGEVTGLGTNLTLSGWGMTETSTSFIDDLLYTTVSSISNTQCAAVYGNSVVIDSTICTQGNPLNSPCNGDIGGPLVSYHGEEPTLVGVVNFIHRDGCTSGNPSGYVRVEQQVDFINTVISQSL